MSVDLRICISRFLLVSGFLLVGSTPGGSGAGYEDLISVARVEREDYSHIYSFDKANLTGKGPSRRLTEFLKKQHDRSAPPDGFLHVDYEIELVHILEIDEVKQVMKAMVYVEEKWTDLTLSWDPAEFGNLTRTWLPEEDVWLPDILIFNMVSHDNLLHSVRAPVTLLHNGTVIYTFPAVYGIMCEIDVADFPLDTQHCALEVASWDYGVEKLQLDVTTTHMLEHYIANEEWDIIHVNVSFRQYHHEDFYTSEIFYNIHLRRKPLFYVFSLILPSLIICCISAVGLFAPSSSTGEREEKFTLGVTAILTMAVLSLMVSEKVPHSSKNVPLLVGFFMFEMTVVTVATGMTEVMMRIHKKDIKCEPPPPIWVRRLFRIGKWDKRIRRETMRRRSRPKRSAPEQQLDSEVMSMNLTNGSLKEACVSTSSADRETNGILPKLLIMLHSLQDSLKKPYEVVDHRRRQFDRTVGAENDYLWVQLANRLDSVCTVFFLTILILPAIYMMCQGQFFSKKGI